ncbi:50S ribosomal protein L4 [Candidatus Parcubacteria bacterium]|nr:50S ribosomal protein L4 [Candidatus Parcubacteria bacterium]
MAINAKVYNIAGEKKTALKLNEKVFGIEANEALVHQAMVAQMANERQNLAHTKNRSEVRGGGRKPWRQKGTGRARAGSNRSPIWMGGGVTFGPRSERNYKKQINKKMKQKALLMVLSDKAINNNLTVIENLSIKEFKTKTIDSLLKKIESKKDEKRSVLIINDEKDEKTKYSSKNLVGVKYINVDNLNIVDLLAKREAIFTKDSIKIIEKQYNK